MIRRLCHAAAAAVLVLAAVSPAEARPPYRAPRTAAGQPDLQGTWNNLSMTRLERRPGAPLTFATRAEEAAFEASVDQAWARDQSADVGQGATEWVPQYPMARIDGRLRSSWLVSPADGRLPWRPEARRRYDALIAAAELGAAANPEDLTPAARCLIGPGSTANPPMLNPPVAGGKQIVQTATEVAILSEMNHDVRVIRLNGRHPPGNVRLWAGDSIGHWEGETLVVETTNFHPQEGFRYIMMMSPDARVIERFTRVSKTEIRYRFEVDDPATFTAPWRGEMPFLADKAPIYEFGCHEGNYSLPGILAAARQADAASAGEGKVIGKGN